MSCSRRCSKLRGRGTWRSQVNRLEKVTSAKCVQVKVKAPTSLRGGCCRQHDLCLCHLHPRKPPIKKPAPTLAPLMGPSYLRQHQSLLIPMISIFR